MSPARKTMRHAENLAVPACANCGGRATCIGAYESSDNPMQPACDSCCGHGNEDGRCFGVDDDMVETLLSDLNECRKEARESDEAVIALRSELEAARVEVEELRALLKPFEGVSEYDDISLTAEEVAAIRSALARARGGK